MKRNRAIQKGIHRCPKKRTAKILIEICREIKKVPAPTWLRRGVLDEPGVEADAVRGPEKDVLVVKPESGRGEGVGAGEPGDHRDVHQSLLERHQRHHPHHRHAPRPVNQRLQERNHRCFRGIPSNGWSATRNAVPGPETLSLGIAKARLTRTCGASTFRGKMLCRKHMRASLLTSHLAPRNGSTTPV